MTLELSRLREAIAEMGQQVARHKRTFGQLVEEAQAQLMAFPEPGIELRQAARTFGAAMPTEEPVALNEPLPDPPARFTVIGADGAQIAPDRHGVALYYLINIGSLVYRHSSGETPEARSVPHLHYQRDEIYEGSTPVSGGLLGMRRDRAELTQLADLVEAEPAGLTLALVDGTLLLWAADNVPAGVREREITGYLAQFDRIRRQGAAVAAFTSRPQAGDVVRLLHLVAHGGDADEAGRQPNLLERVPDGEVFQFLDPGARSALFVSPRAINQGQYAPAGHEICFFYTNVAIVGEDPIVARVELPFWAAAAPDLLRLVHGGVVSQSRIAGGFPYVLARADELAYISGPERQRLEEMVSTALLAAGVPSALSHKALYKSMTRRSGRI
jgi:hypothetical protein